MIVGTGSSDVEVRELPVAHPSNGVDSADKRSIDDGGDLECEVSIPSWIPSLSAAVFAASCVVFELSIGWSSFEDADERVVRPPFTFSLKPRIALGVEPALRFAGESFGGGLNDGFCEP